MSKQQTDTPTPREGRTAGIDPECTCGGERARLDCLPTCARMDPDQCADVDRPTPTPRERHTPGPWHTREPVRNYAACVMGADGNAVADLPETLDGRAAANAVLIARAPDRLRENERLSAREREDADLILRLERERDDLAKALRRLAGEIEDNLACDVPADQPHGIGGTLGESLDRARAALAKLEGGAS